MVDADLYMELHSVLKNVVTSDAYSMAFTFQPICPAAVEQGQKHGGNSLGIAPVNQSCKLTLSSPNVSHHKSFTNHISQGSAFSQIGKATKMTS
jgi:hypothetical protein